MSTPVEAFHQLSFYTLSHGDPSFIHQHIVDAFAVQEATHQTKPIALVFGLAGLYLSLEKGMTGREVQLFHMKMARYKRPWPVIELPLVRGAITVVEVLRAEAGPDRDRKIREWCASVWAAYAGGQQKIREMVREFEAL